MQISSPLTDVSETVSTKTPSANGARAERLLSPNVVQLDTRAFKARPVERASSVTKAYGPMLIAFFLPVMLLANWFYLPNVYSTKEVGVATQTLTSPPLSAALEVGDVELRKISVNGKKIALVAGHIINRSGNKLPIPQLNIVLRQKDGQNVTSWRYRPQRPSLKAGTSLRFTSKYNIDVKDGNVVEIQFVSRDGRQSANR